MPQQAVLRLFMAHRGALVEYATGIVKDHAQAEDLVQEAWLRLDQVMHRRLLEQPLGYLYRIVRNLALDSRRRMRREGLVIRPDALETDIDLPADDRPSPETAALYCNQLAQLHEALAELPGRTRIALEMHRFGGCKLKEIAAFLGVSVTTAHQLVFEGVEHCKRRLGWP